MPETDLDQRLRRALALGHEPDATREAMGSLVQALPRYRARRRALVGATGGSVLGVVGLVIGLVVVGVGGPSPTTVAGGRFGPAAPQAFSAGATCVEVQV
jgi:hypothetical protein